MLVPILQFIVSLAGIAAAFRLPGWADVMILAGSCALASLFLLLRAVVRAAKTRPQPAPNWIVIDGSNVMYWKGKIPQIETVNEVVRHLSALGFTPGVMFDANVGYLVSGRYQNDRDFGRLLNLPFDRIMVVPKGTPADPYLLAAARELGARIVTNDRYRDWTDSHPEIRTPGHLIRGEYRSGQLWLGLTPDRPDQPASLRSSPSQPQE